MKTHINKDQELEIVRKYTKETIPYSKLGRLFKISDKRVIEILEENGVRIRSKSNRGRKYPIDDRYFYNINVEEKAYFLGMMFSDGNNNQKAGQISVTLNEEDKEILEKLRDLIQPTVPLCFKRGTKSTHQNTYRLMLSSRKLSNRLNDLGCTPRKSLTIEFPKYLRNDLIRHFMRGYFDGDGTICWHFTKKDVLQSFAGIVSSRIFIQEISKILTKQRIDHTIKPSATKGASKDTWVLGIRRPVQILKFLNLIYHSSNIKMNRKWEKSKEYNRLLMEYINTPPKPKGEPSHKNYVPKGI